MRAIEAKRSLLRLLADSSKKVIMGMQGHRDIRLNVGFERAFILGQVDLTFIAVHARTMMLLISDILPSGVAMRRTKLTRRRFPDSHQANEFEEYRYTR